ncbi:hypothetical protein OIV83_003801 [Microbotryomycetes sp. JL201]|nr:hypothetical protein OIV83_003801 [Microbotryomycetes sp. JL201]
MTDNLSGNLSDENMRTRHRSSAAWSAHGEHDVFPPPRNPKRGMSQPYNHQTGQAQPEVQDAGQLKMDRSTHYPAGIGIMISPEEQKIHRIPTDKLAHLREKLQPKEDKANPLHRLRLHMPGFRDKNASPKVLQGGVKK